MPEETIDNPELPDRSDPVEGPSAGAESVPDGADAAAAAGADPGTLEAFGSLAQLLERGGPIVAILIVLSILSLALILLKIFQFWRARTKKTAFVKPALDRVEAGDLAGALTLLDKHRGPVARMMAAGIRAKKRGDMRDSDVVDEIARQGAVELGSLQSYFRWLEVIGNISPLLGLLGTVIGMIRAFQQLEAAGNRVDPAILSGGIWEALLTTAVGLAVAIPAITALNLFESRVDQVRLLMRDVASRLGAALHLRPGAGEHRAAAAE